MMKHKIHDKRLSRRSLFSVVNAFVALIVLMSAWSTVNADDTDVFFTSGATNPNVLFVMDNSGSMTEEVKGTGGSVETKSLVIPVSQSSDDAEEFIGGKKNKKVSLSSSDLEMNYDGSNQQYVGLRFQHLEIPRGAKIKQAYIQFTSDKDARDASSNHAKMHIYVQSSNDAPTFKSSSKNISSRSIWSSGKVSWEPKPWKTPNIQGLDQRTPDLNNQVQYIINRGGWQQGNAIVFIIRKNGQNGTRSANSYNGDRNTAPYLFVKYEAVMPNKSRMQVMQEALSTVLTNAPDNLSVGIMNYGDTTRSWRKDIPNGVKFPITPINDLARPVVEESLKINGVPDWNRSNIPEPGDTVTVRTFLSQIANDWQPAGMTPIVDAIYEAARYYRGESVYWGYGSAWKTTEYAAHPATYEGEPLLSTKDYNSCDRTSGYRVWNGDIAKWRSGTSWGKKCPADRFNPVGPGLGSNCAATEYNCGTGDWYKPCTKRTPRVTKCIARDEDGNCKKSTSTGGQCIQWGAQKRDNWCYYAVCKYNDIPRPIYKTPITGTCNSNFIVLMSDGKPEYKAGTNKYPPTYDRKKNSNTGIDVAINNNCTVAPFGFKSGRCGAELTHYLAQNDNSSALEGDQFINTYVVGFASGITPAAENYLKSLVTLEDKPETANKDGYFSAQNDAELTKAFKDALDEIAQEARSQASPGYSVNVKSGLEHEDSIYIPVFDKNGSSRWSGNIKKFRLVDDGGHRSIRGKVTRQGNANASGYIDAMTELGLFKDDAWDEWSESDKADGNDVKKGGAASLLKDPDQRKLYSNITANKNLTADANKLVPGNSQITNAMLFDSAALALNKTAADAYRIRLINFIRGWKKGDYDASATPKGVARLHMGDMLHSEPVIITYQQSTNNSVKHQYLFAGTNEGYLHVFDSTTGQEKFAFMPKELLGNIHSQYTTKGNHKYGIDGNITFWHKDDNHNGNVDNGEKVYLYFGLRRGGHSYYALDISDIDYPKMLWNIDNNSSGFADLGESWSMPYLAHVRVDKTTKPAVIFSGGNDPDTQDHDDQTTISNNQVATQGRDLYIVDALTGELIWSMRQTLGNTDVKHALTGGVRILDVNRNGILDRLYFADTGGNVWRLDLSEKLPTSYRSSDQESVLTQLAELGGSGVDSRKFYNEPDVATLSANGKTIFTVSIGSGLRAQPLNEDISDHMFVLLDTSPLNALPDAFKPIVMNDLEKLTITTSAQADASGKVVKTITRGGDFASKKITQIEDKRGWYVKFPESGEKVLATSITFEGSIVFTTLVPEMLTNGELIDACAAPGTQGRIYALDILTGKPRIDIDQDGDKDDQDVFETISASEIPGTPQRIFNGIKCDSHHDCVHDVDIRIGKKNTEVGTENVAEIESIYWNDPDASK